MSRHMIEVDFNVVKTLLLGTRGALRREHLKEAVKWLDKIDELVEGAAYDYASARLDSKIT